mmetsp:Transcript_4744/g.8282  ORF Transcript_4744/g.8282 Transcript_4744/m.8282 type:complete len:358 (-) Transcript_4744:39-1112(-)
MLNFNNASLCFITSGYISSGFNLISTSVKPRSVFIPNPISTNHSSKRIATAKMNSNLSFNTDLQIGSSSETQSWAIRPYISTGYRIPGTSIRSYLLSAFQFHNETFNIWSHFLSSLIFLLLSFTLYHSYFPISTPFIDKLFISLYCLSTSLTFFISTLYHLLRDHSLSLYIKLRSIDFQSILLLITASYIPALHLAYNHQHFRFLRILYLSLAIILFPIASIIVQWSYKSSNPSEKNKFKSNVRNLVFCALALWGIVPTLHTLFVNVEYHWVFVKNTIQMWTLYAIGFIIYALKVPEKYQTQKTMDELKVDFKRKIAIDANFLLKSHEWWHVFTVAGAVSWLVFLLKYQKLLRCSIL